MPGEARDGRGLRACTADVADGEAPAALPNGEEVVEVAAGLVALAGCAVDDLDFDAWDFRQLGWQQAALQGLADGGAFAVEAGSVESEGSTPGEVLGEFEDLLAETLLRRFAKREHADHPVAGHKRQD